jgi:hypothetical protein
LILALIVTASTTLIGVGLSRGLSGAGGTRDKGPSPLAMLVLALGALLTAVYAVDAEMFGWWWRFVSSHATHGDAFVTTLTETQPLWTRSPRALLASWGPVGLTAVLGVAPCLRRGGAGVALLVAAGAAAAVAFNQLRFEHLMVPSVAAFAGVGAASVVASAARASLARGVMVLVLVAALYDLPLRRPVYVVDGADFVELHPALVALGELKGEGAVLADWRFGHWIVGLSRRAVISSPLFHTPWHVAAFGREAEMWMQRADRAPATLAKAGVGYVLLTDFDIAAMRDRAPGAAPVGDSLLEHLVSGQVPAGMKVAYVAPPSAKGGLPAAVVFEVIASGR